MSMHPAMAEWSLKSETKDGQAYLWCEIRRQWMVSQPEEEVRQRLIQHLIHHRAVARGLIGVEKEIQYHQLRKRFDLVVFDRQAQPFILAECKAPSVPLSQHTLAQIARYNAVIQAPHLLLTNGLSLLFFSRDTSGHYQFQPDGWLSETSPLK